MKRKVLIALIALLSAAGLSWAGNGATHARSSHGRRRLETGKPQSLDDTVSLSSGEASYRAASLATPSAPLSQGSWYGDVYVLPYTYNGTYNKDVNGVFNSEPRKWVAQSFYQGNPDTYDFVVVFTNFSYDSGAFQGFYTAIKNDTTGLGLSSFDFSDQFRSAKLQGYVDLKNLNDYLKTDGSLDQEKITTVLNHEIGHRWLAHAKFVDSTDNNSISDAILSSDKSHWNYFFDTGGSYLYGNNWNDNHDGTFTSSEGTQRYSKLDLYLMGMIPANDVGPLTLLRSTYIPASEFPEPNVTIQAQPVSIDINNIISAIGTRIPDSASAPHEFRVAVLYLTDPNTPATPQDLDLLNSIRTTWQQSFFQQTGGRGLISPYQGVSPGSNASFNLSAALQWLANSMQAGGYWQDAPGTQIRETAEAIRALEAAESHLDLIPLAVSSLETMTAGSTELKSQQAESLIAHQRNASQIISAIQASGSSQTGWGEFPRYVADTISTAKAIRALKQAGNASVVAGAWAWLEANQNADGGFPWQGGGPSAVYPTLEVLLSAKKTRSNFWTLTSTSRALQWLLTKQNSGGFGEPYPSVPETCLFLDVVQDQAISSTIRDAAVQFVVQMQQGDGSWNGSVYETSLAISTLAPYYQSDPYVSSAEMYADPASPFEDDSVAFHAAIHNGGADLSAGLGYRWEIVDSQTQVVVQSFTGTLPAIAAGNFVSISDTIPLTAPVGSYTLRLTIDPDHQLVEKNRDNDVAAAPFTIKAHAAGVDLVLMQPVATPETITTLPQSTNIAGLISNEGQSQADNAVITVYDGDPGAGIVLGTTTISVPALGTTSYSVDVVLQQSRNYQLTVVAEPADPASEADASNNSSGITIVLEQIIDVAVDPSTFTALPAVVTAGDSVTITANVFNRGTLPESSVHVGFTYTIGGTNYPIQLVTLVGAIQPGETRQAQVTWRPNAPGNPITITVAVDPEHLLVDDVDTTNNRASTNIVVNASTLPNLTVASGMITVTPANPLSGQSAHITASVINAGVTASGPFVFTLWLDAVSGTPLAILNVPDLQPGASTDIGADWNVTGNQDRLIYAVADSNSEVQEFNEDDNTAFSAIDVYTVPDLMITAGQIGWSPEFPHAGESVSFVVTVNNLGDQPASNVPVDLIDENGGVLASTTIPAIAGHSQGVAQLSWIASVEGQIHLGAHTNAAHTISEVSYDNNSASVTLAVQNGDMFLTDPYFSPNGDSVKDTTTAYFRQAAATVVISNTDDEVVRTLIVLSGQFSATWDGKNESGVVVKDGSYLMTAGGLSTHATVDNNGSSITENPYARLIKDKIVPPTGGTFADYINDVGVDSSHEENLFFFTELSSQFKFQRFNWQNFITVGDANYNYYDLQNCSNDGTRCVAQWNGTALLKYPGPQIVPIAPPVSYASDEMLVRLSPDGHWILWAQKNYKKEKRIWLQSADDTTTIYAFSICDVDPSFCNSEDNPDGYDSIHWAPDSSEAVVTAVRTSDVHGKNWFVLIRPSVSPTASFHFVDDSIGVTFFSGNPLVSPGFVTSVDFEKEQITWLAHPSPLAPVVTVTSLIDGSTLESGAALPQASCSIQSGQTNCSNRRITGMSNDGSLIEYFDNSALQNVHYFYDWRSGHRIKVPGMYYDNAMHTWSPMDRIVFGDNQGNKVEYLTTSENLIVALAPRTLFGNAGIAIGVTAADKYLDRFVLDYADVTNPTQFHPIGVGTEPMYGEDWGTWLPRVKGRYILRLTAYDFAGNVRSVTKNVTWSGENDIANLYAENRYISPVSSPDVKDSLVFHYTALKNTTLLFQIQDLAGTSLRTISVPVALQQDQLGNWIPEDFTTEWDGKDNSGNPMADGQYMLNYRGAFWPVTVDNTSPQVSFEIDDNALTGTPGYYENKIFASATDINIESWQFQSRPYGQNVDWSMIEKGTNEIPINQNYPWQRHPIDWIAAREFRMVVNDLAGNESVVQQFLRHELITFADDEPKCRTDSSNPCVYPERPQIDEVIKREGGVLCPEDATTCVDTLFSDYNSLLFQNSIWGFDPTKFRLEYRVHSPQSPWNQGSIILSSKPLEGTSLWALYWDHETLATVPYDVRLVATNQDGADIFSPIVLFVPKDLFLEYLRTDLQGAHFRVTNVTDRALSGVTLSYLGVQKGLPKKGFIGDNVSLAQGQSAEFVSGCDIFYLPNQPLQLTASGNDSSNATHYSGQLIYPLKTVLASYRSFVNSSGCSGNGNSIATGLHTSMTMISLPGNNYISGSPEPSELEGWSSSGGQATLDISFPQDPTGVIPTGYKLLMDGAVVASVPAPNSSVEVPINMEELTSWPDVHQVQPVYEYASGEQGLLNVCLPVIGLVIDRTPPTVSSLIPGEDDAVCPDWEGKISLDAIGSDNIMPLLSEISFLDGGLVKYDNPRDRRVSVEPGPHEVMGMVFDQAGNAACKTNVFTVSPQVSLTADPLLFSPVNTSGSPTSTLVNFIPPFDGTFTLEVRTPAGDPVKTFQASALHGEQVLIPWDARDEDSNLVPDGAYNAELSLDGSSCGNHASIPGKDSPFAIEVDKTPPSVAIVQPHPGDVAGASVELRGFAFDQHFQEYKIQVRDLNDCETCWVDVSDDNVPKEDPDDLLGTWDTDLYPNGQYEIRVLALDLAGNTATATVPDVQLLNRNLIRKLNRTPDTISPANQDGKFDASQIQYRLGSMADLTLEIQDGQGQSVYGFIHPREPAGDYSFSWDGTSSGNPVEDGPYTLLLHAEDPSGPLPTEELTLTIVVDNTPPLLDITNIVEDETYALPLEVRPVVQDQHPGNYTIQISSPVQILKQGTGNLAGTSIATLVGKPDGNYQIQIQSADRVANSATLVRHFVINSAALSARIQEPFSNAVVNTDNGVSLQGTIAGSHLSRYEWSYAPGSAPADADFVLIAGSPLSTAGSVQDSWNPFSLPDGTYSLRLAAFDQQDQQQHDQILLRVDNTPPDVSITDPIQGAMIDHPISISGSVADAHLSDWLVDIQDSAGNPIDGPLATDGIPRTGVLAEWPALPPVGSYRVHLRATDDAGNVGETTVSVQVVESSVQAPINLTANVINLRDAVLNWQPGAGAAPSGYNVYRDGVKVNSNPVVALIYTDFGLADGTYVYTVRAINVAGTESIDSNSASVTVNAGATVAVISSPVNGQKLSGSVDIIGTASSDLGLKEYRVFVQPSGGSWTLLATRTASVVSGLLYNWSTAGVWADGNYNIKLEAEDIRNTVAAYTISVTVDNTPPANRPAISASLLALDGDGKFNDIRVTWTYSPLPSDFAGYYLYRNELLANAPAPLIGSQLPYLLSGTSYDDKNLPDGDYIYKVTGADSANNESQSSDPSATIHIDLARPHATIVDPLSGTSFNFSTLVTAQVADIDVKYIRFEYQKGSGSWTPFATLQNPPWTTVFAPPELGAYQLKAIASDRLDSSGEDLQAPASYTLKNILPAPVAVVDGGNITLTWQPAPNGTGQLVGYNVYRGTTKVSGSTPIIALTYTDTNRPDNAAVSYTVRGVYQNVETPNSNSVTAVVYTSTLDWIDHPVTTASAVDIHGANVVWPVLTSITGIKTADLQLKNGNNFNTSATVQSLDTGKFTFLQFNLQPGMNVLRSVSSDTSGNRSKTSDLVPIIRHDLPLTPGAFSAITSGSNVQLSWTASADADSTGFRVYLDGATLNETASPFQYDSLHTVAATSDQADMLSPVDAPVNYWQPSVPASWEWTWADGVEISQLETKWTSGRAAVNLDVDVRVSGQWLWLGHVMNNSVNNTSLKWHPYMTITGVRVRPESCSSGCRLSDVLLTQVHRTTGFTYSDLSRPDGMYTYTVTQVNRFGQESDPATVVAHVPDQGAIQLSVTPGSDCGKLQLNWQPPNPFFGTIGGYIVYRSATSGGPYQSIAFTGGDVYHDYTDSNLDAQTEYYQISAVGFVNGVFVETSRSNEASASAQCSTSPVPEITLPTRNGTPVQWPNPTVDIFGKAVPGSTVTLTQNGSPNVKTTTAKSGVQFSYSLAGNIGYTNVSDDGRYVVYGSDNWATFDIQDLMTGQLTQLSGPGTGNFDGDMSPDGRHAAYVCDHQEGDGKTDLCIYDRITGTTTDIPYNEYVDSLSYSPDGRLIAYVGWRYNPDFLTVETYDTQTGQITTLMDRATGIGYYWRPAFSPDMSKLAVETDEGLTIYNFADQQTQSISGNLSITTSPFSPDGNYLLYTELSSSGSQYSSLWLHDWNANYDANLGSGQLAGVYSGDRLLYFNANSAGDFDVKERSTDWKSLHAIGGQGLTVSHLVPDDHEADLFVTKSGLIFVPQSSSLIAITDTGTFRFQDVALAPGSNEFVARQTTGGTIEDSLPIIVNRPAAPTPDAWAQAIDSSPQYPNSGSQVNIAGVVANIGATTLTNCLAVLQVTAPDGSTTIMKSQIVTLSPGTSTRVQYTWDTTGLSGLYTWKLFVDPADDIAESDESDNTTEAIVPVAGTNGVAVTTHTDSASYFAGSSVSISNALVTTLAAGDYTVNTTIEDEGGYLVAAVDSRIFQNFAYNTATYGLSWIIPTDLYPGVYRVHAVALRGGVIQAESTAEFTLVPEVKIAAQVSTDSATYTVGDAVNVTGRVTNNGVARLDNLKATFQIVDAGGGVVSSQQKTIAQLPAGTATSLLWVWTGTPAGTYLAKLQIASAEGAVYANAVPAAFSVGAASVTFAGTIQLSSNTLEKGTPLPVTSTATNNGTQGVAGAQLTLSILNATTLALVSNFSVTTDIAAGQTYNFPHTFDTSTLPLGSYLATLSINASGLQQILAQAPFTVADLTAPQVRLITPGSGLICDQAAIQVQATDAGSGVLRAFYELAPTTQEYVLNGMQNNMYGSTWVVQSAQDGSHRIDAYAEDASGNTSQRVSVTVDTDSNAPSITTSAPAEGILVKHPLTITFAGVDARLSTVTATLNGQPYTSGTTIPNEGSYTLAITAIDRCNHTTQLTRHFVLEWNPKRVPNGTNGTGAAKWTKNNPTATSTNINWDTTSCSPLDTDTYNVVYGYGSGLSTYTAAGADCTGSNAGSVRWDQTPDLPPGETLMWWVIVDENQDGVEGSWGMDSTGNERKGTVPSGTCGATLRVNKSCE